MTDIEDLVQKPDISVHLHIDMKVPKYEGKHGNVTECHSVVISDPVSYSGGPRAELGLETMYPV
jgi:hypothetical protein